MSMILRGGQPISKDLTMAKIADNLSWRGRWAVYGLAAVVYGALALVCR